MITDFIVEFKERITSEYDILKKCLKYFESDSLDVREYSSEEDDKLLLKIYINESLRDTIARDITKELFLPLIFVNLFKLLDELLIYVYGISMKKSINPYMGYTPKAKLFSGQDIEFNKEKYAGLDLSNIATCKELNLLSNKSYCGKYIKIYENLYKKRNTLVHNKYYLENDKVKFHIGPTQVEELTFDDIYYLMEVVLYGVDQTINIASYRKTERIEHYYGKLSFINFNNSNQFIPGLIYVIESEYSDIIKLKEDIEKLKNKIMNIDKREPSYIKIRINGIEYLMPFRDYENITHNFSLKDLENYKDKEIKDYEDLTHL